MEMLRKKVPQSFVQSVKVEKTVKGVSERKGKKVQSAILANEGE
jgi:hypothetical protein